MLKVYTVTNMFSVDSHTWTPCGVGDFYCVREERDTPNERAVVTNKSWNEMIAYLKSDQLDGVRVGHTRFRRRPFIQVSQGCGGDQMSQRYFEGDFLYFSYTQVFKECKDMTVTVDWLTKHCTAEEMIQYLKEHGL